MDNLVFDNGYRPTDIGNVTSRPKQGWSQAEAATVLDKGGIQPREKQGGLANNNAS